MYYRIEVIKKLFTSCLNLLFARTFPIKEDGTIKILTVAQNQRKSGDDLVGIFRRFNDLNEYQINTDWDSRRYFEMTGVYADLDEKLILTILSYAKYSWKWKHKKKELERIVKKFAYSCRGIVLDCTLCKSKHPLLEIDLNSKTIIRFIKKQRISLEEFIRDNKYIVLVNINQKTIDSLIETGLLDSRVRIFS